MTNISVAYNYDLSTDYKTAFMADVSTLISAVIMPRESRILAVQALIDAYIRDTGKSPDSAQLERLSDAILYEELTDTDTYKIAHNEYPFMSEWQFELRRDRETSLKVAEEYGTDGTNYAKPVKRRRSDVEQAFIDFESKSRNRQRSESYRRDTSPSEPRHFKLHNRSDMEWLKEVPIGELAGSFVDCVGISDRMIAMSDRAEVVPPDNLLCGS